MHCYVFDIAPKKIEGKKRYFQGRVWVDDHDFQIVKTYGKTVPDIRKNHGRRRESVSQVHHLAAADRRPVLVPGLYQGRRRTALQAGRRAHPRDREVRRLQALRHEREDSVRRKRSSEGAGSEDASRPKEAGREEAAGSESASAEVELSLTSERFGELEINGIIAST